MELKDIIFEHLNFRFDGEMEFTDFDGVYVKYDGKTAVIGYDDKPALCRALFLFAMEYSKGNDSFEITQHKYFKQCGVMLDCSRNAVATAETAKKYIRDMASVGFNMLMLYTEDTYEIPEYPYFGYLRGRYSQAEIKEIDAYAAQFGIELVPCVQTLAHLSKFLKWPASAELCDMGDILLIDEPETYNFIEAEIRALRNMFSSKKIHIGMDEAHNVGLGKYLAKHGYTDRFELLSRHLGKVIEICKEYDFEPMMWSDMYFRLASPNKDYYDDVYVPQEVADNIPEVGMVYWDYYHDSEEHYTSQIKKHKALDKPVIFAGGIRTWYGHLVELEKTLEISIPALRACIHEGVDTVFATQWGDDGNECNLEFAMPLLSVYSELFYRGEDCTLEDIAEVSEFLANQPFEITKALGSFDNEFGMGKRIFYSDLLYGLSLPPEENMLKMRELYMKNISLLEDCQAEAYRYSFAYYLYKICMAKIDISLELQKQYKAGNTEYLRKLVDVDIPELRNLYSALKTIHRRMWLNTYKPFGFETLSIRYGGIISRLDDAAYAILDYLNGKAEKIAELEEERLDTSNIHYGSKEAMTPTADLW